MNTPTSEAPAGQGEAERLRAERDAALQRVEALEHSERDFRRLLDDSSDPIFAIDASGRYRYVNEAFARGVRRPRDQVVGHTMWDVFGQAEGDHRWATLSKAIQTREVQVFEVRVPRPDGDRFYLTTVQPVFDAQGVAASVMCSSKEITERKRMEGELKARLAELEDALAHVKRLQGILPICAHCHRIRTDPETWERVEKYISEHSDARFSHGLCPDCAPKFL